MIVRVLLISLSLASLSFGQQVVVVVLDDSGSMDKRMHAGPRKIDAAKSAMLTVLEQLPTDAEIGIVTLNGPDGSGKWIKPLGPVDRTKLKATIRQITAGGATPLGEFMKVGTDALLSHRAESVFGDYRLLIVTDGEATDAWLVDRYLPDILSRAITIDVIGVDMAQDHSLATRVDSYRRADDPESLTQAIQESLAETQLDGNDPDERANFELLQGWPDELAVAAIGALCRNNDLPIGENPPQGAEDQVAYNPTTSPTQPQPSAPANQAPQGRGLPISTILVGIALLLAILFGSALKGMRRG
jgi:uncharacterized protein YegL